jgi:uncharacterized protein YjiS (DUF1127 family)
VNLELKMQKRLAEGSALLLDRAAGEHGLRQQADASSLLTAWLRLIRFWMARHRQRKALGEIAELNDYLLQDIGVTQEEALREAAKPFWQ